MLAGYAFAVGIVVSLPKTRPTTLKNASLLTPGSQIASTLASAAMPPGIAPALGRAYSVMTPAGVTRPILLLRYSVNQTFPSDAWVRPDGMLPGVGIGNSDNTPVRVLIRAILLPEDSVIHMFPSAPSVIADGPPGTVCAARICGLSCHTLLAPDSTIQKVPSRDAATAPKPVVPRVNPPELL